MSIEGKDPKYHILNFHVIILIFGQNMALKKFVDSWGGLVGGGGWFLLRLKISKADPYKFRYYYHSY